MSALRIIEYLVIGNAALLVLQSVRVIATYSAYYSLIPDRNKRQLPLHVWLIACSYLMYVLGTSVVLYLHLQAYGLARSIWFGIAGLIGQYALWNVLGYERRQYNKVTLDSLRPE